MLTVKNLSVSYPNNPVLNDLNFVLKPGDFLAVLGKNGSGKTTLLRAIAGNVKYTGEIRYNDKVLTKLPRTERAKIVGVVEQGMSPAPFSVYDVVCMGRTPYARMFSWSMEDLKMVEHALKKVGVWELRNRLITEISAGELQKTLIAKVLAQDVKILLLDEPTSHLDLQAQLTALSIIQQLRNEGKIIIGVFHDINLARIASHVLFLARGEYLFGKCSLINEEHMRRYLGVDNQLLAQYLGGYVHV